MEGKSGRTIKGNLRNFGKMLTPKLESVYKDIRKEDNDVSARYYCENALFARGYTRDKINGLLPPKIEFMEEAPKETSSNTFTLGELMESHEQTLRFLLEKGLAAHRKDRGSGAAYYRTYLRIGGRRWPESGGDWDTINEALENNERLGNEMVKTYSVYEREDRNIIVGGGED